MEPSTFDNLSNNLIRKIAFPLSFTNIKALCRTNRKFNDAVCRYQIFWYDKLVRDYGVTEKYSENFAATLIQMPKRKVYEIIKKK